VKKAVNILFIVAVAVLMTGCAWFKHFFDGH